MVASKSKTETKKLKTKKVKGVELIAHPLDTVFRIPIGRTYKKNQPVLTLLRVEPTDSEVYTNVVVYNADTDDEQTLAVRHTYEYEIIDLELGK